MSLWPDAVEVRRRADPYWHGLQTGYWLGFLIGVASCTAYAIAWGMLQ